MNQKVFRYNSKIYPYSSIESEFLLVLENGTLLEIAFLFIDQSKDHTYYCRSFFPKDKTDYSKGQMQYTLLKKTKKNKKAGVETILYDRNAERREK